MSWLTGGIWSTTKDFLALGTFAMGLFTVVGIVFSPIWVLLLAYYIGDSACRGFVNRFKFYNYSESFNPTYEWWDSIGFVVICSLIGATIGWVFSSDAATIGLAMLFCFMSVLVEFIYLFAMDSYGINGTYPVASVTSTYTCKSTNNVEE